MDKLRKKKLLRLALHAVQKERDKVYGMYPFLFGRWTQGGNKKWHDYMDAEDLLERLIQEAE